MKELLILRHAKSSWKEPGLTDHDRPLNGRGRRDAPRIGRLVRDTEILPDVILCSTARRARQTVELLVEASSCTAEVHSDRGLYLAGPDGYLELSSALPERWERAMVVGHNPGLEELVTLLTGEDATLPTAALARVGLAIESWSELAGGAGGQLLRLWIPRELD